MYRIACFISGSIRHIFQELFFGNIPRIPGREALCTILVQNSTDLQVISKINIVKTIIHTEYVLVPIDNLDNQLDAAITVY